MEEENPPELQVELRELQEERLKLSTLKEQAGYKYLIEIADDQIKARTEGVILVPLQNMDGVLEQEFAKGEVAGIKLFREMVDVRLGDLAERIDEILKEIDDAKKVQTDGT